MSTHQLTSLTSITDDELILRVKDLVRCDRNNTARLVAHLAELGRRRLFVAEGCSSLFTYCTQILHLSEHAAYNRIVAARLCRRFPVILDRLADGSLHLTAIKLLAPCLSRRNHRELLDSARHRSKREIEELVARIKPLPDAPAITRKLPGPSQGSGGENGINDVAGDLFLSAPPNAPGTEMDVNAPAGAPASIRSPKLPVMTPLAPNRYKVQLTVTRETRDRWLEAQAFTRHRFPDGDPAAIFDLALKTLLKELRRKKLAETSRPRKRAGKPDDLQLSEMGEIAPESAERLGASFTGHLKRAPRHIPADVKRRVWSRDAGQCAFRGSKGPRCTEVAWLEFHHVKPHAAGGQASVENIELRCRMHNGYEADLFFGVRWNAVAGEKRGGYLEMPELISLRGV